MKTKFEDNVASKEPKASTSTEPELPWKVTDEDTVPVDAREADYRETITGVPPLKASAVLIVLLILAIFAFIANTITNVAIEKYEAESAAIQRQEAVSALEANLKRTALEKNALGKSASELERKVGELSAQKELFTAVIETLSKKADEEIAGPAVSPAPTSAPAKKR